MNRLGWILVAAIVPLGCQQERYDVLLRGGRVVDGTGSQARRADVGIRGDEIAALGDLAGSEAGLVIDATNLVVAPGFIDKHGREAGMRAPPSPAAGIVASLRASPCGLGRPPSVRLACQAC